MCLVLQFVRWPGHRGSCLAVFIFKNQFEHVCGLHEVHAVKQNHFHIKNAVQHLCRDTMNNRHGNIKQ